MTLKKELLVAFHSGKLTALQQQELEEMIVSGTLSMDELDQTHEIENVLFHPDQIGETTEMDQAFYRYLNAHNPRHSTQWSWEKIFTPWWRMAMAISLMVVAFWLGTKNSSTLSSGQPMADGGEVVHQLLSNDDVTERIHLVANVKNTATASNQKVIDALLFTLNTDESANVRLACIETLCTYIDFESVRTGLIRSIPQQESPTVLAHLADAIRMSGHPLETQKWYELLNKDLPPPLLKSMEEILPTL